MELIPKKIKFKLKVKLIIIKFKKVKLKRITIYKYLQLSIIGNTLITNRYICT